MAKRLVDIDDDLLERAREALGTVSYTHLDVYKRQVYTRSGPDISRRM